MHDISPIYFSDEYGPLSFNEAAALVIDIDPADYEAASHRDPDGRSLRARVRGTRRRLERDANATPQRLQADVPTKHESPPEFTGFGSVEWQLGPPPTGNTKPDYDEPIITRAALVAWCDLHSLRPAIFATAPDVGEGWADESGALACNAGAGADYGRDQLELLLMVGALAQAKGRDYLEQPSSAGGRLAERLPNGQVSGKTIYNHMRAAREAMRPPVATPARAPAKRLNKKTHDKLLCTAGALLKGEYVSFDDYGTATLANIEAAADLIANNLPPDTIERPRLLQWLATVAEALNDGMK